MSKPIPKAIASAVMLTIGAATMLTFTRGDNPQPNALSASVVPGVSGTTAPDVSGHTPKPSASESASVEHKAAKSTATTSRSAGGGRATSSTTSPPKPTKPTPSPSSTPTPDNGLAGLLNAVLNPGH